jgi:uncharacterized membrane protein YbhN (UPF0104 family)
MDPGWLLGGLLCAGLSLALSAWRWQACLLALDIELPLGTLVKINLAATAAGYVSFGSLGADLAKLMMIGRSVPGVHGTVFTSIILDHISALPCMVAMVLLAAMAHGVMPELDATKIGVGLAITAGVVVLVGGLARTLFKPLHSRLLRIIGNRATWNGLMIAMCRTVPVWLAYCGVFYCAARALGLIVPLLGFIQVTAIADGVSSLPVTIAGLGVREQAFRVMLGNWYGVPAAAAVALSLTGFSLSLVWAAVGAVSFGNWSVKSENSLIS